MPAIVAHRMCSRRQFVEGGIRFERFITNITVTSQAIALVRDFDDCSCESRNLFRSNRIPSGTATQKHPNVPIKSRNVIRKHMQSSSGSYCTVVAVTSATAAGPGGPGGGGGGGAQSASLTGVPNGIGIFARNKYDITTNIIRIISGCIPEPFTGHRK